ncbi:hypothetical protein T440DRAFT_380976, partial [Plenodomus tracheiphilus IPT5]
LEEKLASILGPERMKFQLLPSGHSGIDPPIAQHKQKVATQNYFHWLETSLAEQRHFAEERKRQAEHEEAERLKISILLNHYRAQYVEQVAALVKFGPQLNNAIDQLSNVLLENEASHSHLPSLVSAMMKQIFEPALAIIKEMKEKIPLEEQGSAGLKSAWPLERLEKVLMFLHERPNLPQELQQLVQAIEMTGRYICQPTPFKNPLPSKPQP